ncbi:MAG TPA: LptF/LptG family permease [Tepidisphaeraceae bacterium]|jgi:lipopolysaccharide export LptBFGC system permease protein LptF|nr:LptF/LptG family permease [Tepidisphaeraceae bacterium]
MSKTLFWYVMRDLLKVFLMTSVVLAGIMSFGGLLKPLMQYGLSGGQVAQMLMYFMPATQTWSLPIAALFATTVVYGRLAADNELTACRAHGISYLTMALPAFWLGITLACVSFACLSFIVPRFTLRAEKVAFQSLADVVQKNILRSHQLKLEGFVIYAEDAEILPPQAAWPGDEVIRLTGPMFCTYETRVDREERTRLSVPEEFYTARSATVVIHQAEDHVEFTAYLEDGMTFPRKFEGAPAEIGGLGTGQFRSMQLHSPIKENTKFMDLHQLRRYFQNPAETREIRELYRSITQQEQETTYLNSIAATLKIRKLYEFSDPQGGDGYVLELEPGVRSLPRGKSKLSFTSGEVPGTRNIRLIRTKNGQATATDEARNLSVNVQSDLESKRMQIEFQLGDVAVVGDEGRPAISSLHRPLSIPMTPDLLAIDARGPEFYMHRTQARGDETRGRLYRKLMGLRNGIESEIHSRASFAVSCLILVMVGCALGMMFKTGNYLSAFALSVVPALLTIALMITGQHVSENSVANSLSLGLGLIWAGNVIVFGLAIGLLGHLRRQ